MTDGGWRKSSYCEGGACVECRGWRKSSRSGGAGECVEVGHGEAVIGVRDSKDCGSGPVLAFSAASWQEFTRRLKADARISGM